MKTPAFPTMGAIDGGAGSAPGGASAVPGDDGADTAGLPATQGAPKVKAKPRASALKQSPSVHVAGIKAKAAQMLKSGVISKAAHDGLVAKANKAQAALAQQGQEAQAVPIE